MSNSTVLAVLAVKANSRLVLATSLASGLLLLALAYFDVLFF